MCIRDRRKNAAGIAHKAGDAIEIKRILDLREFPETPYADLFTKNFDDILHDADIRIVVEKMCIRDSSSRAPGR